MAPQPMEDMTLPDHTEEQEGLQEFREMGPIPSAARKPKNCSDDLQPLSQNGLLSGLVSRRNGYRGIQRGGLRDAGTSTTQRSAEESQGGHCRGDSANVQEIGTRACPHQEFPEMCPQTVRRLPELWGWTRRKAHEGRRPSVDPGAAIHIAYQVLFLLGQGMVGIGAGTGPARAIPVNSQSLRVDDDRGDDGVAGVLATPAGVQGRSRHSVILGGFATHLCDDVRALADELGIQLHFIRQVSRGCSSPWTAASLGLSRRSTKPSIPGTCPKGSTGA